jgi:hypothetical protein
MPRSPRSSPDPTPAQRLRLELAVAQAKLEALRREVDATLAAGPVTHELAAGLALRLRAGYE